MNQILPDLLPLPPLFEHCRICGGEGPDSSGRCYDCVNVAQQIITTEMRDVRSMRKLREIEKVEEFKRNHKGLYGY